MTSILTSQMMVTKNPQNVHRKYFWAILMTFISDVKIDIRNNQNCMSSIMVLGYPAEMYTFGGQYVLNSFGWALGYFLSGFIYVPVLYPLKTTTTNEVITFP